MKNCTGGSQGERRGRVSEKGEKELSHMAESAAGVEGLRQRVLDARWTKDF